MGLSRTVSEIDGDFSRKSQNLPTPMYFAPPLKVFPLELGIGSGGQKTRKDWPRKKLNDIFSRLDRTNERDSLERERERERDGRTDGRTPGHCSYALFVQLKLENVQSKRNINFVQLIFSILLGIEI